MALDKEKALATAQKYTDKKQYAKAIREYEQILAEDPDDLRVMLRLASCCEYAQETEKVCDIYMKVGSIYRERHEYQKALAVFKQAQKCKPENDDIAIAMSELYNALGLTRNTVDLIEQCLSRCDKQANPDKYLMLTQTLVRFDSENVQTRLQFAKLLVERGDLSGASRQYQLALAQLLSKERYVDYMQTSREYLKIEPKDVTVLENLALIYSKMNRYTEALVILSVLKPIERTSSIHELLVTCYTRANRPSDAASELKIMARKSESSGAPREETEELWRRVLSLNPSDIEAAEALGEEPPMLADSALNVLIKPVNAAPAAPPRFAPPRAASVSPDVERTHAARLALAQQLFAAARYQEAAAACEQIIDGDERNIAAIELALKIYETLSNVEKAAQCERKMAKAVFERSPNEAVRHIMRAEQFTPGAWENYNLMQVLGLNPGLYGLHAPTDARQNARGNNVRGISSAHVPPVPSVGRAPNLPPIPSIPRAGAAAGRPVPPPMPPNNENVISRKVLTTMDIPAPVQKIPTDVMRDLQVLEKNTSAADKVRGGIPCQCIGGTDRQNAPNQSSGGLSSIGRAVSDGLDDVFDGLFAQTKDAEDVDLDGCTADNNVIEDLPVGIPDSDRQNVVNSIQEIDFYISLHLVDDARGLLNTLIAQYGDVDIIHEARLRVDCAG